MKSPTMAGKSWMVATVAAVLVAAASTSHGAALNTKLEVKCFDALAKATGKHQAAVAKARAKCRDGVISGKLPTGTNCTTDADTVAAIDKSAAAIAKSVTSKCKSTCSVSGADCIDNLFCPPNGALPENCTAGAKGLPFSAANMGFPGSYCEAVLGGRLEDGAGFGACMAGLAGTNAELYRTTVASAACRLPASSSDRKPGGLVGTWWSCPGPGAPGKTVVDRVSVTPTRTTGGSDRGDACGRAA